MAVDGGRRIADEGGNLVDAGARLFIDAVNTAFSGGTKAPTERQQDALIAAGYTLQPQNQANPRTRNLQNWISPTGQIYGPSSSREIAQQLVRNPPAVVPPLAPPVPSAPPATFQPPLNVAPVAPSIPDQAAGFPVSIPLPNIPGLPSSIPIPAIPPAAWPVILGPVIAGGLFYPTPAGRGSDLRDLYGMPAPKKGRTRTPGRRARGRGRTKIPNPWGPPRTRTGVKPQPTSGRGGPVTIGRPNVRTAAPPVAIPAKFPKPAVLRPPGAGVKINTGPIKASPPARIPQTAAQRAAAIARTPFVRDLLGTLFSTGLGSLFVNSPASRLGRINLPNTAPGANPLPMPLPGLATNPLAWSYAVPRTAALAQATEQDCTCRPVRKKSKKKACKNPVTSRRSFMRGARKFVTTTKELKCQA